jgi:hypothetical protein
MAWRDHVTTPLATGAGAFAGTGTYTGENLLADPKGWSALSDLSVAVQQKFREQTGLGTGADPAFRDEKPRYAADGKIGEAPGETYVEGAFKRLLAEGEDPASVNLLEDYKVIGAVLYKTFNDGLRDLSYKKEDFEATILHELDHVQIAFALRRLSANGGPGEGGIAVEADLNEFAGILKQMLEDMYRVAFRATQGRPEAERIEIQDHSLNRFRLLAHFLEELVVKMRDIARFDNGLESHRSFGLYTAPRASEDWHYLMVALRANRIRIKKVEFPFRLTDSTKEAIVNFMRKLHAKIPDSLSDLKLRERTLEEGPDKDILRGFNLPKFE